ncbi:hypothetical protein SCARD494_07489 [Seiridium cardinale]
MHPLWSNDKPQDWTYADKGAEGPQWAHSGLPALQKAVAHSASSDIVTLEEELPRETSGTRLGSHHNFRIVSDWLPNSRRQNSSSYKPFEPMNDGKAHIYIIEIKKSKRGAKLRMQ